MAKAKQPLISIIMPAHNAGRFIAIAINSVLEQTYPHWELLIVDDASSDDTPDVVARYIDPRIRYQRVPRIGHPAGVRNVALRAAQGQYIAFLDADDLYYPDTLERLLTAIQDNPETTAIYGFAASINEQGSRLHQYDLLVPLGDSQYRIPTSYKHTWDFIIFGRISCLLAGLILPRETFERVGFFNEDLCGPEDYEFYIRLFLDNREGVKAIPQFIYQYRIYESSLTKAFEHYDRILQSQLKIMAWFFSQENLPTDIGRLKSRAYTECYRYQSRERLVHRQFDLCRKIAIAGLQDPNVHRADWVTHCLPLLLRTMIPAGLNDFLIQVRGKLRRHFSFLSTRIRTIQSYPCMWL